MWEDYRKFADKIEKRQPQWAIEIRSIADTHEKATLQRGLPMGFHIYVMRTKESGQIEYQLMIQHVGVDKDLGGRSTELCDLVVAAMHLERIYKLPIEFYDLEKRSFVDGPKEWQ